MNLYVLRHASAGTRRANPLIDVKRPLDKEGKQQCVLVANCLNALRTQFDVVASSPLKRALQTASLVGNEIGHEGKILVTDALAPGATLPQFQKLVTELSRHENVLVVGHSPNLQQFLSSLIGPESTARPNLRMRKSALARVDLTQRPGLLVWLLDPRLVRLIYAGMPKSSRKRTASSKKVAGKKTSTSRKKASGARRKTSRK
ncbi:MAG TPA: phosphohistidine phosphatase SixA [Acidisarcina sp.]